MTARAWLRMSAWLLLAALVLAACGGGAARPENGELVIDLSEFAFDPSAIELTAGETVTLVLRNTGDKVHEFMAGRNVRLVDGVASGFEEDLFEGVDVTVDPPSAQVMGEMEMGGDEMGGEMGAGEMGGDHAGHTGFMVVLDPGDTVRVTFRVPDKVGEWQFGCFQEDGAHWDDGMRGTLTIVSG